MGPGVASSEMEYTEVFSGGCSKGKGLQQTGKHAFLLRIPRTPYECRGIITATFGKRVRKDLMAFSWSIADSNMWFITVGTSELYAESSRWAQGLLGEVKHGNLSHDDLDDSLQKQTRASVQRAGQAEQQGRRGKGAKPKDGEAY